MTTNEDTLKRVAGEKWLAWDLIQRHPGNSVTLDAGDALIAKLAKAVEEQRHALEAEAAWHDAEERDPDGEGEWDEGPH